MKFRTIAFILALSVCTMSFQSCIGRFAVTKKLHTLNQSLGNKWVNELVFLIFIILPVYGICILVDGLVVNSIEFWAGSNPVGMGPGESETKIVSRDGKTYKIEATQNRFHVVQTEGPNAGETVDFVYNPATSTWSFDNGKQSKQVLQDLNNGQIKVINKDGTSETISREAMDQAVSALKGI